MSITIREARLGDAQAACGVLRRSIIEVCGPDYCRIEGFIEDWLHNKTPETVRMWIESEGNHFVVACAQVEVVGVGCLSRDGEVLLCYVVPEHLRQGVGREISWCFRIVPPNGDSMR